MKMAVFCITIVSEVLAASIIEAASTSVTSANFYQTTRRNNPEDNHLLILKVYKSSAKYLTND
jgi:hypothetical protein